MFAYINNELSKKEITKTIPFAIASKGIKFLGVNVTKKGKDFYTENYKTFLKENKEDTNKWKDILHLWIGRLNIGKM